MKRRLTELSIVILGILIGVLGNIATSALPEMLPADWRPYLWLAWAPLALAILLVLLLEWRTSRDAPPATWDDTRAGDTLDVEQAQGVVIRPSAPVAQTNVSSGAGGSTGSGDPHWQANVSVGESAGTVIGIQHIVNQPNASSALHQLRAPVGDFVGREREIEQLVQALSKAAAGGAAATISGVRGMGGIGKTELAYAAAQQLTACFPDAQLLVELRGAGTDPLSSTQALQTIIRAFEREARLPDDLSELRNIYCSVLAGKNALILADDAKDAAQVRALLPPAGCVLLITSRNRFTLPGMAALDLGTLPPQEAEQLLLGICERIGEQAAKLAKLCGELPLALRVSASLLANSSRSVARYLEQLAAERLTHLSDPDDPQASVEASLRLSYDALEGAAQAALAQMSVFAASFDLAAALAVLEVEGDAEAVLDLLVRRSLLEWDEHVQRYSLHDLVRAFVAARLEDANTVRLRHAEYYEVVAEYADDLYLDGNVLAGLALFDQERVQIDAGWTWVREHTDAPEVASLMADYANATAFIGRLRYDNRSDRIPQLEALLEVARRQGWKGVEAMALGNLGGAYLDLDEPQSAVTFFEQHLTKAIEIGDRVGEGNALGNLGQAYALLGDTHRAIELCEQRLRIAREIGDRRGEQSALAKLGASYRKLGDMQKATEFGEQALAIAREIGDLPNEAVILSSLGRTYKDAGNTQRAIELLELGLEIAHRIGDRQRNSEMLRTLGSDYENLANAYVELWEPNPAIELLQRALCIERDLGDAESERQTLLHLGNAYVELGEIQSAIESYEQSLELARELDNRKSEGHALCSLGIAYTALGEPQRAIEFHEQSLERARDLADREGEGRALLNLGNAYVELGELQSAIESYERGLIIKRELGDRRGEGIALTNLGDAYNKVGNTRKALTCFKQYLILARSIGDRRGEAITSWDLGLALEKQGDLARAAEAMQICVDYEQEIGHLNAEQDAARLEQLRQRLAGGNSAAVEGEQT